ncbi:MAG: nitroreductase family protein [Synergistaceae bacterium]|nr:nitroreductase family protein [Synergistaceae bacterium]
MDERIRLALSQYRYEKALKFLRAANSLLEDGDTDSSANRSYYAVFYAMLSVTALDGFESGKHSGVISYFNHHYVKTGIFSREISDMITEASKQRECADYKNFYTTPHDKASGQISNAENMIGMIRPYLESAWTKIKQQLPSAIFTRTSTRQFTADKVDSKYIIKILRAAMAAPSAVNQQPWEFWVSDDPEINAKLSQATPYATPAKNAPVVIVPCYRTNDLPAPMMVEIDMAICAENILIEAEYLGLGAVMLGIAPLEAPMKHVAEVLKLPENFRPFMLIPVGYPVSKRPQEDRYEPAKIHTV